MPTTVNSKELAYGAAHPCFAVIATEPANGLPTYENGKTPTELVKVSENISRVEGKFYADNKLSEKLNRFDAGTLEFESKGFDTETKAEMFGLTVNTDGEVLYNSGDEPPYVGFGHYREYIEGGKTAFEGVFYPKCQPVLGNENSETRKDSITFASKTITLNLFEPNSGDWKITKLFATKDEVIEWLHEKLNFADAATGG